MEQNKHIWMFVQLKVNPLSLVRTPKTNGKWNKSVSKYTIKYNL